LWQLWLPSEVEKRLRLKPGNIEEVADQRQFIDALPRKVAELIAEMDAAQVLSISALATSLSLTHYACTSQQDFPAYLSCGHSICIISEWRVCCSFTDTTKAVTQSASSLSGGFAAASLTPPKLCISNSPLLHFSCHKGFYAFHPRGAAAVVQLPLCKLVDSSFLQFSYTVPLPPPPPPPPHHHHQHYYHDDQFYSTTITTSSGLKEALHPALAQSSLLKQQFCTLILPACA